MTAKYDPAEVERLLKQARDTEYPMSVPSYRVMADQLEAARTEIEALTVARNADRTEWMTTYAAMRAELEALRCYDLEPFFAGELKPGRAERFRVHLADCAPCQSGLHDLVQLKAIASAPPREPRGDANG
jgi:hypothetical protein